MKFYFKFKSFVPLILIFSAIIAFVIIKGFVTSDFSNRALMLDFMAGFFLVFGGFKTIKLSAFAEAYGMYDIIAKRSRVYAHIYPFIEIALGLAFLFRFEVVIVAWITLILMSINSIGAYIGIRDKKVLMCACLGTVFKLPMSFVSLGEDLLMVVMAIFILLGY
jgi:hypothetical protein